MPAKPRIVLDCDSGLDDAIAILTAAYHGELAGITTVNVGTEHTTHNALMKHRGCARLARLRPTLQPVCWNTPTTDTASSVWKRPRSMTPPSSRSRTPVCPTGRATLWRSSCIGEHTRGMTVTDVRPLAAIAQRLPPRPQRGLGRGRPGRHRPDRGSGDQLLWASGLASVGRAARLSTRPDGHECGMLSAPLLEALLGDVDVIRIPSTLRAGLRDGHRLVTAEQNDRDRASAPVSLESSDDQSVEHADDRLSGSSVRALASIPPWPPQFVQRVLAAPQRGTVRPADGVFGSIQDVDQGLDLVSHMAPRGTQVRRRSAVDNFLEPLIEGVSPRNPHCAARSSAERPVLRPVVTPPATRDPVAFAPGIEAMRQTPRVRV